MAIPEGVFFKTQEILSELLQKNIALLNEVRAPQEVYGDREFPGEIFTIEDIKPQLEDYYQHGLPRGVHPGWKNLSYHYRPRKGEWTVITGTPGHGKSSFLDHLMINLALNHKWKFGVFSAENYPVVRHVVGLIEKYTGIPFSEGPTPRLVMPELSFASRRLNDCFYFLDPSDDHRTVDYLLDIACYLKEKKQIDGFVIDPWNELDHSRPVNMLETEYVSDALSKIRRVARTKQFHIWLVAHPVKLQRDKNGDYPVPKLWDISGSAHFFNKADNGLCVWRDPSKDEALTQIHIQKIRFAENGKVGVVELKFNKVNGRFEEENAEQGNLLEFSS